MKLVVGEYERDHGFFLPNPVSIHREYLRPRFQIEWCVQNFTPTLCRGKIKNENTWYRVLAHSRRMNKGTHKAMNRLQYFHIKVSKNNTKTCWVLKCDIRKFFANIDHEILKNILSKCLFDMNILWLFSQVIDSFKTPWHIYAIAQICQKGLPLGNLTSQLLVNIYMNEFDQFMKRKLKVKYYIRYADDFVILHHDKSYLAHLRHGVNVFLKEKLKLQLHPDKVFIKTIASSVDFLGWVHFPKHRILRTVTKKRMFKKIKNSGGKSETIHSYLGMLKHGNAHKLEEKIKIGAC